MKPIFFFTALATASFALAVALADKPEKADSPVELGTVNWGRDLDEALAKSKESGKPIFALFQEVPGCSGCQQFGKQVLSHPVLARLIASEFVPLAIHNNKPGKDREVLERFKEPAWNYQVVRFFDADANDLIPRRDRVWTLDGIAGRMVKALREAGKSVPPELKELAEK
ncbi:MAG: thioredoxin family protein [Verrucomicrobiales bacterium]